MDTRTINILVIPYTVKKNKAAPSKRCCRLKPNSTEVYSVFPMPILYILCALPDKEDILWQ